MTTQVEKSVIVNVPVSVAYNQWTQFEEFPHFMSGVQSVEQLSDTRLRWVAEIGGVKREWEADILEQVPDQKVAWAASEGATNAGAVRFEDIGGGQTRVHLSLEFEPEGLVEKAGDALGVVERTAQNDLDRFKAFIEDEGYASGAWRGTVVTPGQVGGTPDVDDAAASRGDSGKAGISKKAAAAGLGLAAAGIAAVASATGSSDKGSGTTTGTTAGPDDDLPYDPATPIGVAAGDLHPGDPSTPVAPEDRPGVVDPDEGQDSTESRL
ncbi:SRPBCC family protein [Actinotalea sp. Marseille-Q4924]|uniref:SRPBCC family protein n=1 Tax=Actinotalea sp. Marseille-Q4924 TaxID=2866571 RepID=UPI001CE48E56|nr:SRPBCC family protein [Actinotalea sp. Marseille-Q4924]